MNHNKIAAQLGYLANTRSYTAFHSQDEREHICQGCDGDFCRERVHDAHKCIYRALLVGATAIYDLTAQLEAERKNNADLLARAEKAEKAAKRLEVLALKLLGLYSYDMERLREILDADMSGRCAILDEPMKPMIKKPNESDVFCPNCGETLSGGWPLSDADDQRRMYQCPNCGQSIDTEKCVVEEE